MTRLLLALALALALAGCGGETAPPIDVDAGCAEPDTAADQPVIACPASVDLGCLGPEGAPIDVVVSTSSCDGTVPAVTCSPADGALVTPGASIGRCVATAPSGATDECTFAIAYRTRGAPMLACAPPRTLACTGPRTITEADPPSVIASCDGGGAIGGPESDAPATGFPVGTNDVHWSATVEGGSALACTQTITVEDESAPTITCPSTATTIVRTSPSAPIAVPGATASDACDEDVALTFAPPITERGAHTVTAVATDDAGLTASCTFDATVVDAFAPTGLRVLSAQLQGDGSTDVTIAWDRPESPDVSGVRLERAIDAAGPFTALMTLPAGTTTYTDASMPSPRAFYRAIAIAGAIEGGVSETVQAEAIAATEYNLRDQTVATVPFATSLFGVVRHPVDLASGAARPLVVFLHGNHGNCRPASGDDECVTLTAHECTSTGYTTTPNAQGYLYLQDTLAAQGYVTVSLSANALNCRDDYIPQRTQLVLEHLRRWASWASAGGAPFGTTFTGHVDLSRVALFGHSRGGEAVAAAPTAIAAAPIAGVTLASVFAVGPTDYHDARPSGVPFAVLLPGCDADVRTLEGLEQYDRGLDVADANARAQVLFAGANHNFFNREWRFDDNQGGFAVCSSGDLVGAPAQRGMLEAVLADWLRGTVGDARLPAYLRAESGTPGVIDAWAGRPIDLRWSYAAAARRVIDDFVGAGAPTTNDLGGVNSFTGYTAEIVCTGTCAGNYPHLVGGVRLAWQDATATTAWPLGTMDATGYAVLSLRFASRIATINDGLTEHDFRIGVRDAAGVLAEVPLSSVGRLAHRYPNTRPLEILSTVRVPLAALVEAAPSLDVARLTELRVTMPIAGGNTQGSIWVANVELASD